MRREADQRPVAVVGSANLDYLISVEELPKKGETIFGTKVSKTVGGKGLNQAVAISRAGTKVSFHYSIGADADAEVLNSFLEKENIEGFQNVSERATGAAYINVADSGDNQIVVVPGANLDHKSPDVDFQTSPGLLVLQCEINQEKNIQIAKNAKQHNWQVALTPAPVKNLPPGMLDYVDILLLNETECMELTAEEDALIGAQVLARRIGIVVLTMGEKGSYLIESGRTPFTVRAERVKAVDTTAAGDTFCGFLLSELNSGKSLQECAETATLAAAWSVQKKGAAESIPNQSQLG